MNAAAYHHYALDYALLTEIVVLMLLTLIAVAKLDGDRQKRARQRVRPAAPHAGRPDKKARPPS